ncbi:DUF3142 domain-containing protein [Candidatus Bealeia paramacronuclearis]|uniref:DUF3142 domain-containing protein n=1 Tax=Candidatus Bealeia paramacronuclearis TaxID=1921001 RepID=A0ABZ2C4W0_9PROT|nr:hypothetical protein [Candidatus Bealeia paramacronuclearis]
MIKRQAPPIQKIKVFPWRWLVACFSLLILGAGSWFYLQSQKNFPVDYWIWAGIRPEKGMENSVFYIYQGILRKNEERVSYERLGLFPHPTVHKIYIVYRISGGLPHPKDLMKLFERNAALWIHHNVKVVGLQLDFDSPTSKLLVYNDFLSQVKSLLKPEYQLSITGLGDWILFGQKESLRALAKNTDEIIFQLYQDRQHFSDIKKYIHKLARIDIPFKVGLLNHQTPNIYINQLQTSPYFKGVVLFVQKKNEEKL